MKGSRVVTAIDVLERIAYGLAMPDEARVRLGLAPRGMPLTVEVSGKEDTRRRTVLGLGLVVAVSPNTLGSVLRDSAAEAMEFTRTTATSAVGAGTLEHLEAVVADLDGSYSREPPAERFAVARAYRQRVEQLLHGRHTLKEARELYVYAAWLSELLAWLAHDLGSPLAAEAYAIDCYEHADQAGHDELCAWAADAMSSIAMYTARPRKTVQAAQKGMSKVPDRHPLGVRLRAQAARGYARLGKRAACVDLLAEARKLHDQLPATLPGRLSVDTGALATYAVTAYPVSSYIWLEDYHQAEAHARTALAVHASAPAANRSPSREAIAHIDLGIALANLGVPDEAADHGRQALSSARVVDSVLSRAGELDAALMRLPSKEASIQGFHVQYRELRTEARSTAGE